VTVARYRTPGGTDIDLRGIHPDMACTPPLIGAASRRNLDPRALPASGPIAGVDLADLGVAARQGAVTSVVQGPEVDRCLLTAMSMLADKSALIDATAGTTVAAAP
jgi:hypothetical protein